MSGWKSNPNGTHFRSKRKVGISSNKNNDYSSGTQPSSIRPSTHKSPKKSGMGIRADKDTDKKKYQRALDTIHKGNIPNTDAYQPDPLKASDEAELRLCTINLDGALQNYASTDKAWEAMKNLSKLMDNLPDETKQKYLEEINTIVNYRLKKYYDNATYLYCGTGIDELENMLTHDNIGAGGSRYSHVPVSVFPETSTEFTNDPNRKDTKVLITFYKDMIEEDVIFQGYDVNTPYDSEEIYTPQGMKGADGGEVRIHNKTVPYQGKIKQLIFPDVKFDSFYSSFLGSQEKIKQLIFPGDCGYERESEIINRYMFAPKEFSRDKKISIFVEQQRSEEVLDCIFDYEIRINKEKIIPPYPEPEYDVYGEGYWSGLSGCGMFVVPEPEYDVYGEGYGDEKGRYYTRAIQPNEVNRTALSYVNEEGRYHTRDYSSTAQHIAEIESDIIENMHKNSAGAVDRAIDYIEYWLLGDYGGPLVDEAAVNIKRRIKAGINVMPPPYEPSTDEECIERYYLAFPEQAQQIKSILQNTHVIKNQKLMRITADNKTND